MAKPRSIYRCTECGHEHPKWVGRCEACGAWNAVAEEPAAPRGRAASLRGRKAVRGGTSATTP
ncbi:MAG TPA: DNA repair protein RadA, partial [Gemmatimonadales bacterium]|nr:DNA repair protein RadA [Gemmatimonadales bacterium]